jgi:hypothetical protein
MFEKKSWLKRNEYMRESIFEVTLLGEEKGLILIAFNNSGEYEFYLTNDTAEKIKHVIKPETKTT